MTKNTRFNDLQDGGHSPSWILQISYLVTWLSSIS